MSLSIEKERQRWIELFERVLPQISQAEFSESLLKAKEAFFAKLGRSHERNEDRYESVSQSFLEWYIFDFLTPQFQKSPASIFLVREMGQREERDLIREGLFHTWSLFEVEELRDQHVVLNDLLLPHKKRSARKLLYDPQDPVSRSWRVKPKQIIQARLFPSSQQGFDICSHFWLHAETELQTLREICQRYEKKWAYQETFLRECLDCLIRSMSLQDQMQASRSANWIYRELGKKYAA